MRAFGKEYNNDPKIKSLEQRFEKVLIRYIKEFQSLGVDLQDIELVMLHEVSFRNAMYRAYVEAKDIQTELGIKRKKR